MVKTKARKRGWWGLQRAWEQGELSRHPLVMLFVGLLFVGFLTWLYLRGGGAWSQYDVTDFSQVDSRSLSSESINSDGYMKRAGQAFRFSIRVEGKIDGQVDLSVHHAPLARLSGKVDWSESFPHDDNRALVTIHPIQPCTGKLTVHYRFHTRRQ